jgi:hypothetical protein
MGPEGEVWNGSPLQENLFSEAFGPQPNLGTPTA